jgi:hypothetical protein
MYQQHFYSARRACYFWFALYLRGEPKEKINSASSAAERSPAERDASSGG